MAVLLVSMSIMAIMMTVAMPVWKQMVQREKEEELIFRGTQYVHAIALFQRKTANAYPPNIDLLVRERYLRKKYKDPITNDDFVPLPVGAAPGGVGAGQQGAPGTTGRGQTPSPAPGSRPQTSPTPAAGGRQGSTPTPFGTPSAGAVGGISGVASKSKDKSIRIYNGRTHYNEWTFVYVQQQQAPGAGAGGATTPGGRGVNPGGPGGVGGRGGPPNRGGPTGPNRQGGPGGFGPQRSGFPSGPTPMQPMGPGTPRGRF
jgi:type II secretory pathway pseudopilin PulG